MEVQGRFKRRRRKIWTAVEIVRKGKRKFERKRKRCKVCREEMDVTEELKIVGLLLYLKILYVGI